LRVEGLGLRVWGKVPDGPSAHLLPPLGRHAICDAWCSVHGSRLLVSVSGSGLRFGVQGLKFRFPGLGFRFKVPVSGFRFPGSGSRVQGSGSREL